MLRRLYEWCKEQALRPYAMWVLAAVAFAESSFFPIPPHALIVPMIVAAPASAWRVATVATLASVAGGAFGYLIGAMLWDSVGAWISELYGIEAQVEAFKATYEEHGVAAVLIGGLTPFPYKVITILSGLTGLDFTTFMLASLVSRGAIFFVMAALLWRFGEPIREFIEARLGLVFTAGLALLIGGFVVAKTVF